MLETLHALENGLFWIAALAFAGMGIFTYAELTRRLRADGGRVHTAGYGPLDLALALALGMFLLNNILFTISKGGHDFHPDDITRGAVIYAVIVAALAAFLHFRKVSLRAHFGLRGFGWRQLGMSVALLATALPLVIAAGAAAQHFLGPKAQPQDIVQYVSQAAREENHSAVLATMLLAAIVAPVAEEFIFRGFLYGVGKRFAGWLPSLLVTSLLFAGVHMNAAALAPLFILALALNLAYEATGTILVPMAMHALFNITMLAVMLSQ